MSENIIKEWSEECKRPDLDHRDGEETIFCHRCKHMGHLHFYRSGEQLVGVIQHSHFYNDLDLGRNKWCDLTDKVDVPEDLKIRSWRLKKISNRALAKRLFPHFFGSREQ
jgi:hypothetical protein